MCLPNVAVIRKGRVDSKFEPILQILLNVFNAYNINNKMSYACCSVDF
ncbi:MAG: hypothetical protein HUJ51_02110 [Eggerthellaceae bacterium]|nr:hypothetical protein [Eggerthellaceae bacterium]